MRRRLLLTLPVYALILIIIGTHSIQSRAQIQRNVAYAASISAAAQRHQTKYYEGMPVSLYVPSINLSLEVINGHYNEARQTWLLTGDKAQYATETVQPNNRSGLTLIYGHYNSHVFMSTDNLKLGALVEITTNTNKIFTYKYLTSKVISPTDVSLFKYKGEPELALLTCTGTWFQSRHLMIFKFISVRST